MRVYYKIVWNSVVIALFFGFVGGLMELAFYLGEKYGPSAGFPAGLTVTAFCIATFIQCMNKWISTPKRY